MTFDIPIGITGIYSRMEGYPLDEFLRDFDTVTAMAESEEDAVFMKSLLHVRNYMHETYAADATARTRRGMALTFALNFLCENMDVFDVGNAAVVGKKETIVTEQLLRALHELVVGWVLAPKGPTPTPQMVRDRALGYPAN